MTNTDTIRRRVRHSLSPHTADAAGMTSPQLQQFAASAYTPSDEQLAALARYFRMEEGLPNP